MFDDYFQGVEDAKHLKPKQQNNPDYIRGYNRQIKRNPIVIYFCGGGGHRKVRCNRDEANDVMEKGMQQLMR